MMKQAKEHALAMDHGVFECDMQEVTCDAPARQSLLIRILL
jgi:hypothetical protein